MNPHLKRIKIYFVISFFVALSLGCLLGFFILTNENFGSNMLVSINKYMTYIKYKMEVLETIPETPALVYEKNTATSTVPVLLYHGVLDVGNSTTTNLEMKAFKSQMFALKKAGYNTIDTRELYGFLRGEIKLPPKPIMITFDDGRSDSVNNADPVLQALGYKAVMFVIGKFPLENDRRGSYYLSTQDIRSMVKSGRWDVEAHSYDGHDTYDTAPGIKNGHFFGNKLWIHNQNRIETEKETADRIYTDMKKAKDLLSNNVGYEIKSFAYPFGDFGQNNMKNPNLKNIILDNTKNLFNIAFYQNAPGQRFKAAYFDQRSKDNNFFLVRRVEINPDWSGNDLISKIEKMSIKPLPYTDDLLSDAGWVSLWGDVSIKKNDLSLKAKKGAYGGDVVLDGTQNWKDYDLVAKFISPKKTGVSVFARFKDDQNHAVCNFYNGFIYIEEVVNGKSTEIKKVMDSKINIPKTEFKVELKVKGRTLECIMGKKILRTNLLDPSLATGGIGFKIWDKKANKAEIHIENLSVKNL